MVLSQDERQLTIKIISFPLSVISILSTLFVFYLYFGHRQLQIFPFRLVVYLQLSDFILSVSQFFILFEEYNLEDSNGLCQMQAFLMQYADLATIMWSTIITFLMFDSLKNRTKMIEKKENLLVFFGFCFPSIVAVMFFKPYLKVL